MKSEHGIKPGSLTCMCWTEYPPSAAPAWDPETGISDKTAYSSAKHLNKLAEDC